MLKLLKALADCRNGNFALLTAILAVPVIGAAGMSVDLTRAIFLKRSDLQSALDAAVLAAASTTTTDRKKIDAEAKAMLLSNLPTDLSANTTSDDLVFHEDGRVPSPRQRTCHCRSAKFSSRKGSASPPPQQLSVGMRTRSKSPWRSTIHIQ